MALVNRLQFGNVKRKKLVMVPSMQVKLFSTVNPRKMTGSKKEKTESAKKHPKCKGYDSGLSL